MWPSLSLHPRKQRLSVDRPCLVDRPSATSFDSWHEAGAITAYRGSWTRGRTFCATTLRRSAVAVAANVLVVSSASSAPLDTAVVKAFMSATAASSTDASGFSGCSTGEARRVPERLASGPQVIRSVRILRGARAVPAGARAISFEPRRGSHWLPRNFRSLLRTVRRLTRHRCLPLPAGRRRTVRASNAAEACSYCWRL